MKIMMFVFLIIAFSVIAKLVINYIDKKIGEIGEEIAREMMNGINEVNGGKDED